MIDFAILLPYVAACFLFSIIPGPSVTVVVANSLARGTKAGVVTLIGTEIAMLSMVVIIALGMEAVMTVVSEGFTIIKLVGAAYLVWVGWKMFTSSGKIEVGPLSLSMMAVGRNRPEKPSCLGPAPGTLMAPTDV